MSLILEALKKVERERATPEQRGFLVLAPAAWSPSRSNLAWVLGMIAAAAIAGGAVYALTRPPGSDGAPVPAPVAAPAAPAADPVLRLQAISERDGTPVAVVNDRIVREGDRFDGVRVLRIGAAEVEVEVNGARRILRF